MDNLLKKTFNLPSGIQMTQLQKGMWRHDIIDVKSPKQIYEEWKKKTYFLCLEYENENQLNVKIFKNFCIFKFQIVSY